MDNETVDNEVPTRRAYMKYGGAVVTGSLLAGCSGDSGSESTVDPTPTPGESVSETPSPTKTEDGSYTVEMAPAGEVQFQKPPESVAHYFPDYADMAVALGHGDSVRSLGLPSRFHTTHYEQHEGKTRQEFLDTVLAFMKDHETASQLRAVQNEMVFRGGPIYSGPLHNLFLTERYAKLYFPEVYTGELFDRTRVAKICSGTI